MVMCSTLVQVFTTILRHRNSGYVWVEDKVENAIVGAELGLESLVMEHGFNMNDEGPFTLVKDWKDIYETLIGK